MIYNPFTTIYNSDYNDIQLVFEGPVFCLFWQFCSWRIAIKIPHQNWGSQKGNFPVLRPEKRPDQP